MIPVRSAGDVIRSCDVNIQVQFWCRRRRDQSVPLVMITPTVYRQARTAGVAVVVKKREESVSAIEGMNRYILFVGCGFPDRLGERRVSCMTSASSSVGSPSSAASAISEISSEASVPTNYPPSTTLLSPQTRRTKPSVWPVVSTRPLARIGNSPTDTLCGVSSASASVSRPLRFLGT